MPLRGDGPCGEIRSVTQSGSGLGRGIAELAEGSCRKGPETLRELFQLGSAERGLLKQGIDLNVVDFIWGILTFFLTFDGNQPRP